MTVRLDIRLPADPEAAGMARDRLEPIGRELDGEMWENVRLLVSELVTNSVRHGRLASGARVALSVDVRDDLIRVSVADDGIGFQPPDVTPEPGLEGGWGLYLVDRISSRWGMSFDGETLVWFEIDRPG